MKTKIQSRRVSIAFLIALAAGLGAATAGAGEAAAMMEGEDGFEACLIEKCGTSTKPKGTKEEYDQCVQWTRENGCP